MVSKSRLKSKKAPPEETSPKPGQMGPQQGDMFRCQKCGLEIGVIAGSQCDECSAQFTCCGQEMNNISRQDWESAHAPTDDVQEASEESFPASDPPARTPVTGVARGS